MRRIFAFITMLVMLFCCASCAAAEPETETQSEEFTLMIQIDNPIMTVNGTESEIDPGRNTTPVIHGERTVVPVRAIIEAMGGTVTWNEENQTATLRYNEDEIRLTLDSTTAYLNDKAQTLDVAPVLINDRTMLPIRFIAESFKFNVDWAEETQTITITKAVQPEVSSEPATETQPSAEPAESSGTADSSTIVVYFSCTGEQYGVGTIDEGNTAIIAKMIAERTGADIFEILPKEDHYPMTYDELTEVAQAEKNENARPEIASEIDNFDEYDTVFIGYPIWWGDMPMIVYSFLENYDFEGKTVIPFCTHGGSGLAGTENTIRQKVRNANVEKGLAVAGTTAQNERENAQKAVDSWLSELGITED